MFGPNKLWRCHTNAVHAMPCFISYALDCCLCSFNPGLMSKAAEYIMEVYSFPRSKAKVSVPSGLRFTIWQQG